MIGQWLGGLSPPLLWGTFALVLAATELVVPGVFLIWLAIAAGLTAVVELLVPMGGAFQLLVFSVLSALSVSGGRLWYLAHPANSSDPMLNDRAGRLIGQTVVVAEAIVHGEGRVRVDDSSWPARGPDAPAGGAADGDRSGGIDIDRGLSGGLGPIPPTPVRPELVEGLSFSPRRRMGLRQAQPERISLIQWSAITFPHPIFAR